MRRAVRLLRIHGLSSIRGRMGAARENGIVHRSSAHSVDEIAERLEDIIHAKGLTLFALVDHGG